jgi:hypothetical protein
MGDNPKCDGNNPRRMRTAKGVVLAVLSALLMGEVFLAIKSLVSE